MNYFSVLLYKYTNNKAYILFLAYLPGLCHLELLMAIIGIIEVEVGQLCPGGTITLAGLYAR